MSYWNHRVMRKIHFSFPGCEGEIEHSIYEVYYNDEHRIVGWSDDSIAPKGDTVEELKEELSNMLKCLDKPVLRYETGEEIS